MKKKKKKKKKNSKNKKQNRDLLTFFFFYYIMDLPLSSIPLIPVYNHTMQVNTTLNTMQVNKLTVSINESGTLISSLPC